MLRRLIDNRRFWCGVIAAVLISTIVPAAWRAWYGHDNDFEHYWNAALAMRNGQDIYTSGENRYVYPPLLAFLFQPLTLVYLRYGAVIWISISGVIILASILIVARESTRRLNINPSKQFMIAASAMILCFDKIRSLLSLGQSDAITLLGFACALRWMERNPWLAGLAVGFSANVKYLSLIFVPYFLWKRFYRAAISSVLFFVGFLFLPSIQIGFQKAFVYATAALGGVVKMFGVAVSSPAANVIDIAWNRSVSIPSTIFRLTHAHGWPDAVAAVIIVLLLVATLAIIVRLLRSATLCSGGLRPSEPNENRRSETAATVALTEWAALIILALAFSPQTTMRHMVLMVLVYVFAVALLLTQTERRTRFILIAGIAIMVAALTLPPYGIGINQAVWTWRAIGGASWCALIFLFVLAWIGTRSVAAMSHRRD